MKEEIRARDAIIESLRDQLDSYMTEQNKIIEHMTGMNRVANQPDRQLHSIPRGNTLQSRIKRAEASEANPALTEQRRREYEARIENLLKPEVEIASTKEQVS